MIYWANRYPETVHFAGHKKSGRERQNSTSKAWSSWFISRSWFPLEKYSSALTVRSLGFCCRALSRASKAWHTQSAHSHYTVSTISQLNRWRHTEPCILEQRHRAGSAKAPFSPHATLNQKRILAGAGDRERRSPRSRQCRKEKMYVLISSRTEIMIWVS